MTHRMRLALVAVLAACAPSARDAAPTDAGAAALATTPIPAATRVVDGVTVMEHGADAFERAPRLVVDSVPLAVMGGAKGDPAYDLTMVSSVVPLPDGRVATFSSVGNKLLVFGADGRGQRTIGRTGSGPGDFMNPGTMIRLGGDTLFLLDPANRRFNWVRPDRGVVATRTVVILPRTGYFRAVGALPGGAVVATSAGLVQHRGVPDSIVRPPTPVAVYAPGVDTARVVAHVPDIELAMIATRYRGAPPLSTYPIRFGRSARVAVWDTLIATAHGDGYAIDLHRADGRVVGRIWVPVARRAVTPAMREAQIAREIERLTGGGGERLVNPAESMRLAREAPFADSLPPYHALFATRGNVLWVVDALAPSDTAWSATAFRADGAIVGRLHMSGRSLPIAFGDDRVIVRALDDDDVVTLRVHRIRAAER